MANEAAVAGNGQGLGQPGERHVRFLGVSSEVRLPLLQMAVVAGCDLGTLVLGIVLAMMAGPALVCAGSLLVLGARMPAVTAWAIRHTERNAKQMLKLIATWERFWLLIVGPVLAGFFWLVVPFRWQISPALPWEWISAVERSHWLLLGGMRVGIGPFGRALLGGVALVLIPALRIGRRRFRNEVDSFAPLAAVDPSSAGVDPRTWAQREAGPEQQVTVHVETVQRRDPRALGAKGIGIGDVITHADITATVAQWKALTYEAMRRSPAPTDTQMTTYAAFSQRSWRAIKGDLIAAGFLEPQGNGSNAANAGYQFSDTFRQVLWSRDWSPQKLV